MFGYKPTFLSFLNDLSRAGLKLSLPQQASYASLKTPYDTGINDRVFFSRGSVAYDALGNAYSSSQPVVDKMQGDEGIVVSEAFTNLFTNPDFENNLTDWTSSLGNSTNGSITVSTEQFFVGTKSCKMYGGESGYVELERNLNVPATTHTMVFAMYLPYYKPSSSNPPLGGFVKFKSSLPQIKDGATYANPIPTAKEGWWWIIYSAIGSGTLSSYGVRVGAPNTVYVDAFMMVEGAVIPNRFIGTAKNADKVVIKTKDLPTKFTAGLLVSPDLVSTVDKVDGSAVIATMKATNGDKYKIEYRPSVDKFAVVKSIGETDVEVLSDATAFNPKATIGLAVQQTGDYLKLMTAVPRAICIHFDDGSDTVYDNAFPIMKKYGIPGTAHVITSLIDTAGYMTTYQLRELKENGWTIDSHCETHADLTVLDEAGQLIELSNSMEWLRAKGFDYDLIATPYGRTNITTIALLKKLGYRLHRKYSATNPQVWPFINRYEVEAKGVNNADTVATVTGYLDTAMVACQLINLTFHYIEEGTNATQYTPANFQAVIEHIVANNYPCYSFGEIADAWEQRKILGKVETFSLASATTIAGVNEIYIGSDENGANHFNGAYKDWFATGDLLGARELSELWKCKF